MSLHLHKKRKFKNNNILFKLTILFYVNIHVDAEVIMLL